MKQRNKKQQGKTLTDLPHATSNDNTYEIPTIEQFNQLTNYGKESSDLDVLFGLVLTNCMSLASLLFSLPMFVVIASIATSSPALFYFNRKKLNQLEKNLKAIKREADANEMHKAIEQLQKNNETTRCGIFAIICITAYPLFMITQQRSGNSDYNSLNKVYLVSILIFLNLTFFLTNRLFPQKFHNSKLFELKESLVQMNLELLKKIMPNLQWESKKISRSTLEFISTIPNKNIEIDGIEVELSEYFKILKKSFRSELKNSSIRIKDKKIIIDLSRNRLDDAGVIEINRKMISRVNALASLQQHQRLIIQLDKATGGVLTWIPNSKNATQSGSYSCRTTKVPAVLQPAITGLLQSLVGQERITVLGAGTAYISFNITGYASIAEEKIIGSQEFLKSIHIQKENTSVKSEKLNNPLSSKKSVNNKKLAAEKSVDSKKGYIANLNFFNKNTEKRQATIETECTLKQQLSKYHCAKIPFKNEKGVQTGWILIDEDTYSQLENPKKLIDVLEDYELGSSANITQLRKDDQSKYGGAELKLIKFIDPIHSDLRGVFKIADDLKSNDGLTVYEFGIKEKHENSKIRFSRKNINKMEEGDRSAFNLN